MKDFYPAEDYHQDYFALTPGNSYCEAVVGQQVSKFMKRYKDLAKKAGNELDDFGQAELECLMARVDQLTIVKTRARYTLRQQAKASGA